MNLCHLTQLASGRWYCPLCDPEQKRTLPVNARRNCGKPLPVPEQMLASIRALEECDLTDGEMLERIARCQAVPECAANGECGGCRDASCGQRWHVWRQRIIEGCERWGAPAISVAVMET